MTAEDTTSFWTDIKKYEDILTNDPNSYCFAPLAELYRKLGLLEDAVATAIRGCELHPEYVGGFMALGRAYFDKGMADESRVALEKVARVTPDNLLAQKLLSQIYIEKGDTQAAEIALQAILSLNPADMESRILLDSLKRSEFLEKSTAIPAADDWQGAPKDNDFGSMYGLNDIVSKTSDEELIEELLEAEIVEETTSTSLFSAKNSSGVWRKGDSEAEDPLKTITMADLFESQGHYEQARQIYREKLDKDPQNSELQSRLSRLSEKTELEAAAEIVMMRESIQPVDEDSDDLMDSYNFAQQDSVPVESESDDTVLATLKSWLENIRRLRQCHSEKY